MTAVAPVFIVGTGRCGSTVLFQELTRHPELAWPSAILDRWPASTWMNRVVLAAPDRLSPWLPDASEAYPWWDLRAPGFSATRRDLGPEDVTPRVARDVEAAVWALCTGTRRSPVLKITGWPRIGFLRAIFPDARFVHLVRDGRAVAASLLQRPWWDGWEGPPTWRVGELDAERRDVWEAHGRSPVVLAAIQWWVHMEQFERVAGELDPGSYLEIRYEDLCSEPADQMRRAVEFAGWSWPSNFERTDWATRFRSDEGAWRTALYHHQVEMLERVLAPVLARFGYAASA